MAHLTVPQATTREVAIARAADYLSMAEERGAPHGTAAQEAAALAAIGHGYAALAAVLPSGEEQARMEALAAWARGEGLTQ